MTFWENDDAFTAKSVHAHCETTFFLQAKTYTCLFLFINYKGYNFSSSLNNFAQFHFNLIYFL